jgi:hypothetical protein
MDTRFHQPRLSRPQSSAPCAQCGEKLPGPEWSEPAGDSGLRYLWSCRSCGYSFETLVFFAQGMRDEAA